jgi:hypothetical protein
VPSGGHALSVPKVMSPTQVMLTVALRCAAEREGRPAACWAVPDATLAGLPGGFGLLASTALPVSTGAKDRA